MKRQFKDEDIIRFLFDEMSQAEGEQFLSAICADETLWDRYEYFQDMVEQIPSMSYEPSALSCQKVLEYVRDTAEESIGASIADQTPTPGPHRKSLLDFLPVKINPNAVVAVALGLFLMIGAMSIAYKLQRGAIDNPNTINTAQQLDPIELEEEKLDWDDSDIQKKLDQVRNGIENLKEGPVL
ncbi:MAG: hypothetical protein AAF587_03130 [Bacteroidota bacterium]